MCNALKEVWCQGVTLESLVIGISRSTGKVTADTRLQGWGGLEDYPQDSFYAGREDSCWLSDIREKLQSGQWAAVGYRAPRELNSVLELVPNEIIAQAEFKFEHSTVLGDGLTYVGVRFVSSCLIGPEPLVFRRRGRPTRQTEIIAAYKALAERGEVDFRAPLVRLFPKIRNRISRNIGVPILTLKGVGDEAIRRTIRPLFDRDRTRTL